ncbi:MAG: hypothetical protein IH600_00530 [Bacteroidetes bacterium]|nr:hypothetical protein [Bacteroidota bacterium]
MMRSIRFLLLVTISLSAISSLHADEPRKEVALVTAVSGSVTVRSDETEKPLALGMRLLLGDEVIVTNGKVSLVFFAGDFLSLKDGERLALGATPKESMLTTGGATRGLGPDDAMTVTDKGLNTNGDSRVWQAQLASVSGIRGDGMPIAVAPRLAIAGENPTFYWFDTDTSGAGGERNYTLVLKNEENAVLARQRVRGVAGRLNSFRFDQVPAGFSATPRMHFNWTVLPDGAVVPDGQLDAAFVFIDKAGMDATKSQVLRLREMEEKGQIDQISSHTLLCALFLDERERLFSDGLPHLLALAALPEGEAYAGEQIARMFLRFGNQVATLAPLFLSAPGAYILK